jgi:NADH dehydrogenase FAD-containing subunit
MDEDGYFWGAAAAEAMAATGRHVLLVTRFFEVLREVPITSRIPTLRILDDADTELLPNTFVESTDNGAVVLRNFRSGRRRRIAASAVVWTGMQHARDGLVGELRARGVETHLIGDAMAQRRLMLAIQEAYDLGRRL